MISLEGERFFDELIEKAQGRFNVEGDSGEGWAVIRRKGAPFDRADLVRVYLGEGEDIYVSCVNGLTLEAKGVWLGQVGTHCGIGGFARRALDIADIFLDFHGQIHGLSRMIKGRE